MTPTIQSSTAAQTITLDGGMPKVSATAHFGASSAREFAKWYTSKGSADADLNHELATLRERSRDLGRNHGVAAGVGTTLKDNVVGTGARLSHTPDYRALGKDKEWAEDFGHIVESGFRSWADTRDCDVRGLSNLALLTRQVFDSRLWNGDSITLPLWRPDPGRRPWATQLQNVEADRLTNPNNTMDTATLRGGVEIDAFGKPLAYHIQDSHPGDRMAFINLSTAYKWTRVEAETAWGRKRVLHVFDGERPDQNRGKPFLSAVFGQLHMIDKYQRTEMQSAVINSVIAAFMETPLDSQSVAAMLGGGINNAAQIGGTEWESYLAAQNSSIVGLQGSMMINVPPGTSIKPWAPGRPTDQFGPFLESVYRNICAGLSLPYELVTKDWTKTNYSSARAALLEAWRMFLTHRAWLKTYFLDEVLALWMEEAVFAGKLPITPEEYFGNRYAYLRCKWIWPGRGWVDPVKEAQGAEIRMNIGIATLEDECAAQGADWEEVLDQRAREKAYAQNLGLTLGDNRAVANDNTQDPPPQEKKAA